ncbi:DNA primase [Wenjunlia vitaminophila]|uniref:DNA primase n=2 Tax=Wenjunlia vitaminophila TaxID=76728 RepID=A0A0T6LVJ0_WENVI|nr:bifunctional DNA primase/polymerase [Wenjunlia vitaminophila]KRV50085.1 DNA primase [Wenjunlia vitaminophila]
MGAQLDGPLLESAMRYARERHWDVCSGAWLVEDAGDTQCSCGTPHCPAPGAHPLQPDWAQQASSSPTAVRRMWSQTPLASILLPTGRTFDVIDVPEPAGCLALARMERTEVRLGPVACAPGRRMQFFVLAGSAARVPTLVRQLGWSPRSLDLVGRGERDHVVAPPSRVGALGPTLWARPPTPANRWLPEAEELIGALAYACGRDAAAARPR